MKNNYIDIKRSESSPTEPVTLAQLKAQLYITFTDDDTLLTSLITQARKAIENYCNISIVTQLVVLTADLYDEWELPYGPVTGITSVKTRSANEAAAPRLIQRQQVAGGMTGRNFLRLYRLISGSSTLRFLTGDCLITLIQTGTGFNIIRGWQRFPMI